MSSCTLSIAQSVLTTERAGGESADYRSVPTIGSLFLLNAISSAVVAIGLLAPLQRILHRRRAELTSGLLAGAGVAIAAGSLIALFIGESGKLFGFSETGYGTAMVLAIIAEALVVVLLTPLNHADERKRVIGVAASKAQRHVKRFTVAAGVETRLMRSGVLGDAQRDGSHGPSDPATTPVWVGVDEDDGRRGPERG